MKRILVVLLILCVPGIAEAQGFSTSGTVTARVFSTPITLTNLQDLDFGIVTPGVAKTVVQNTAPAGKVQVTGAFNQYAQIEFTLPTLLQNTQGPPGSTMPISFGPNTARWRRGQDRPNGGQRFNPANGVSNARFGGRNNPYFYVYLGGTVTPSLSQGPGIYQGTIILTITYL